MRCSPTSNSPACPAKLSDAKLCFAGHKDILVNADEMHRTPGTFQVLRGGMGRRRQKGIKTGEFLMFGSAFTELAENLLVQAVPTPAAGRYRSALGTKVELLLELPAGYRQAVEIEHSMGAPGPAKGFQQARAGLKAGVIG